MDVRSKVTLSCTVVILLLVAGVIALVAAFAYSLESDPIKGWQEVPHTPTPPLTVSVSPESSVTAMPSRAVSRAPEDH